MTQQHGRDPMPHRNLPYYGWVIVAVSFVTVGMAGLARLSYSVFLLPIQEDLSLGRAAACLPFSISMLVLSAASPVVGRLLDRYGPRVVMPLGALVLSLGLLLAGTSHSLTWLLVGYGIVASVGAVSLLTVPHTAILSNWFNRRLGLALGIAFSSFGIAAVVGLPLLQYAIAQFGWRTTYLLYAVVMLCVIVPLTAIFQRLRPDAPNEETTFPMHAWDTLPEHEGMRLRQAVRTGGFWLLSMCSFLWGLRLMFVQVHVVAYLIDSGLSPELAVTAFGLTNLMMSAGSILGGHVADRYLGHRGGFVLGAALEIVSLAVLIGVAARGDPVLLGIFVLLYGAGAGMEGTCYGAVSGRMFQGPNRAAILGLITVPLGLGGAAGPYLAGRLYDQLGSYYISFLVVCLAAALSALCVWLAPKRIRPPDASDVTG